MNNDHGLSDSLIIQCVMMHMHNFYTCDLKGSWNIQMFFFFLAKCHIPYSKKTYLIHLYLLKYLFLNKKG